MDKSEGFFHILCIMIFFTNEEYLALSGIYSQKKKEMPDIPCISMSLQKRADKSTRL